MFQTMALLDWELKDTYLLSAICEELENFRPSWLYSEDTTSFDDEVRQYGFGLATEIGSHEFSSVDTSPNSSTDFSFSIQDLENLFPDEYVDFQIVQPSVTLSTDDFSPNLEDLDPLFTGEIDNMLDADRGFIFVQPASSNVENEWNLSESMNTSTLLMDLPNDEMDIDSEVLVQPSVNLPMEDTEIDNQLKQLHLLVAYGEAIENGHKELAGVIIKHIRQSVSPVGNVMERLLYYLCSTSDRQPNHLNVESKRNFYAAYQAFYQIFPYGKFVHFAANSAILQAMPDDAKIIHIYDFDLGDGLQWSSMIQAVGHQQREIKLITIKWNAGDSSCNSQEWKFEETKRRLHDHARSCNINLMVEEITLQDLINVEKTKIRADDGEWCAFNCTTSLPHMGRMRSRKNVMEFLRVAKEFLEYTCRKGIITFGDGDAWEKLKMSSSFTSFFNGYLMHYHTFLESIECNFPTHFGQARATMECLFVAPFVSSDAWIQKWEETRECCDIESAQLFGLKGCKVSKESLMEAKEMVEGENLYGVKIEGEFSNQLVLDWRGIELVNVSCWQC